MARQYKLASNSAISRRVRYVKKNKIVNLDIDVSVVEAEALLNTDGETLLNTDGESLLNTGA